MSNEIENGKYLPVLYTIPRWNLVRGSGRLMVFYVPYIDKFVSNMNLSNILKEFNITSQDYYDRWFLNITVKSDRPKCPVCEFECSFIKVSRGYRLTCCNKECKAEIRREEASVRFKELSKDKEYIKKLSNSQKKRFEDPREREKLSIASKEMWKNEDTRNRIISTRIETFKNHPEISEKKSKLMKITTNTPEYRQMCSDRMKERWKDENYREDRKRILNKIWEDPTDTVLKFTRSKPNTSKLYSEYEDVEIYLDSSWEAAFFLYNSLLNDNVIMIYREPFSIPYINPEDNTVHMYFPDFLVIYNDGSQELIEIKPESNLENEVVKSKNKVAIDLCYLTGIKFRLVTDKEIREIKRKLKEIS